VKQNDAFFSILLSIRELIVDTKETVTRVAPGMRLKLNKAFSLLKY
jgi:hypothetical protein